MSAENRLTAGELAALSPGDQVVIETSGDFRRPRRTAGTVIRIEGPTIVVTARSARGVAYVHHFGRRDGVRAGGGRQAELVHAAVDLPATSEERRAQMRVDAAYRAWARNRGDVEKLRELQAAVTEVLAEDLITAR
ncbi:hypothetical protein ACI8AF_14415 [Blastococcus sp. SYSU D00669]